MILKIILTLIVKCIDVFQMALKYRSHFQFLPFLVCLFICKQTAEKQIKQIVVLLSLHFISDDQLSVRLTNKSQVECVIICSKSILDEMFDKKN